ncbi:XdhC family protein [Saccharopolyspora shandongensis]|uniref:XdhC family protein n=1 Tax=Saccharopolyspora shandongensis TaxID=418495 RepID=UPI0033C393A1
MSDFVERRADLRSRRTPFVVATVVRVQRPTSAKPGDSALVLPDGTVEGFVGGACAESTVRAQGLRLLDGGAPVILRITPAVSEETRTEGLVTVSNPCLSGGSLDIFLEPVLPPVLVRVFGDTPVARALVRLGRELGYEVDSATDADAGLPADIGAVVVASQGRSEEPVLTSALRAGVPYVALVASRRRGAAVLDRLDVTAEQRARVHTPAGLDIGAQTAPEIALSVYAELVTQRPRRAGPGKHTPMAVDPVCRMAVAINACTPSAHCGGRSVYFCGPACREAFIDEPARYPT